MSEISFYIFGIVGLFIFFTLFFMFMEKYWPKRMWPDISRFSDVPEPEPPYIPKDYHLRFVCKEIYNGKWSVQNLHTAWRNLLQIELFENGEWQKIYVNPQVRHVWNEDGTVTITENVEVKK